MAKQRRDCEICKAPKEVRHVENFENKKRLTLEFGHTLIMILPDVTENVRISENIWVLTIKDPIEEVKKAEKHRDYFKFVAYSCSF